MKIHGEACESFTGVGPWHDLGRRVLGMLVPFAAAGPRHIYIYITLSPIYIFFFFFFCAKKL